MTEASAQYRTGVPAHQGADQRTAHKRISSRDLFDKLREIEIDHDGKIYHLRLTQANKLILTA